MNMSRIWKTIWKGFRQQVGSSANVENANVSYGSCPSSLTDHEFLHYRTKSKNVVHLNACQTNIPGKDDKSSDDFNHNRLKFQWSRWIAKSIFLEICGLSSAVALGWQLGQPYKQKNCYCIDNLSSLVKTLTHFAIYTPYNDVRLNISSVTSNSKPTHPVSSLATTNSAQVSGTKTDIKFELNWEINKTLTGMLEKLETCKNLGLSDWQNSVGVDLLTSAKKKKLSEHDHLVCSSSKDRFSAYEREAFLCFKESMKLGSAKGAYNLGICFEQGIGTSVDLGKAATCYEKAASQHHAAAQYNLGLLHYRHYLEDEKSNESDLSNAFLLLRQAASQGLEQAWSAILVLLKSEAVAQVADATSTFSLVDKMNLTDSRPSANEFVFRKALSEPHDLNYHSQESSNGSETSSLDSYSGSVSFYLED